MNGTYYKNPTFPGSDDEQNESVNYTNNKEEVPTPGIDYLPMEQSYIENILRLNKGANAKVFASFPDSLSWRDKIFTGIIEQAGRDHVVMSAEDGRWYLIPAIYVNYVEFDDKIIYRPYELNQRDLQSPNSSKPL